MTTYTRDELVEKVGLQNVADLEALDCEPTGRAGYNGQCQGDDLIEWTATLGLADGQITVYYYTTQEDEHYVAQGTDWGSVDFIPHHYTYE